MTSRRTDARLGGRATATSWLRQAHVSGCPSDSAASSQPARQASARRRDRRGGLGKLLAALGDVIRSSADGPALRRRFEEEVRGLVSVRAVYLRGGTRCASAPDRVARPPEVVSLEVATADSSQQAALEVVVDPSDRVDDWSLQALEAAADVGALVLEIERRPSVLRQPGLCVHARADGAAPLIGSSPAMRALRDRIERIAATDFTVLIEGESGTGKELVARQIHELSRRRQGPFVAINCAALVETLLEAELFGIEDRTATGVRGRRGKFEHADGGTLFLDEVSDLSRSAQAKLLRAIQDLAVERVGGHGLRPVDTRIVIATNRNLTQLAEQGLFRRDLFYRLSGLELHVPALRTRREDILELAAYFLARHRTVRELQLSPAAADALRIYDWPGNVRELERMIEGAVALSESSRLELDDLPLRLRHQYATILLPSLAANDTMRAWGSRYARLVLDRCLQNKRQACQILGITYHTLQAYLRYQPSHVEAQPPTDWRPRALLAKGKAGQAGVVERAGVDAAAASAGAVAIQAEV